jgi:predicted helicase
MAKIYHANLYGLEQEKSKFLLNDDISKTQWSLITPQKPFYLLIPQKFGLADEYEAGWKVTDIFPVNGVGMTTARDHVVIDFEEKPILKRAQIFRDSKSSNEELCCQLEIPMKKGWNISKARKLIQAETDLQQYIKPVLYRPFDQRLIFYHDSLVWRTVKQVMRHMMLGDNFSLLWTRPLSPSYKFSVLTSSSILDQCVIGNKSAGAGASYLAPLYLYPSSNNSQISVSQEQRRPNFSQDFLNDVTSKLGYTPTPEAIFYYIYAIFHSPTYRTRYAEFLKIDFPRVPLTSNDELFRQLAAYGEDLVALHLMKSPKLDNPITHFVERGGSQVVDTGHPKYQQGDVVINRRGDHFTGVPESVWNFHVGGYQVCQKWLKDRKGRTLSDEDILHHQRIVVALKETIELMAKIDTAIPGFPIQ